MVANFEFMHSLLSMKKKNKKNKIRYRCTQHNDTETSLDISIVQMKFSAVDWKSSIENGAYLWYHQKNELQISISKLCLVNLKHTILSVIK